MTKVNAYAAPAPNKPLVPMQIDRRDPLAHDVKIKILYAGICHSDIHQARDEWSKGTFPMVPGHEIVGEVTQIGSSVKKFQVGDVVGVGCLVDSCRVCSSCKENLEQYCETLASWTYNGTEQDGKTPTYGGYSNQIVVHEDFVLRVPKHLPLPQVAPLLCAGITTYSPLRHWKVKAGDHVAVIGLGGLGHMAVKIAVAMGANVTVISRSNAKHDDAVKFGAKGYINTSEKGALEKHAKKFDFIINTVSAILDLTPYLNLLKLDSTLVQVGLPDKPNHLNMASLVMGRRSLAGSLIGGLAETQEMLDFCGQHNITADIELITPEQINEAYERTIKGDVRYRFVIDAQLF
jgi:uncharacterized zinc-type alcohol dehydrogenase-like protein